MLTQSRSPAITTPEQSLRPTWLLGAIRTIARKDSGPLRRLTFAKILEKRPTLRVAYRLIDSSGESLAACALALAHALSCAARLSLPARPTEEGNYAIYGTENERHAIEARLQSAEEVKPLVAVGVLHHPRLRGIASAFLVAMRWPRLRRLLRLSRAVRRRYGGLVWLRVFEFLGFHWRFRNFFRDAPPATLLVSSESAPYSLALWPWLRSGETQSIFVEHGYPVPAFTPLVFSQIHVLGAMSLHAYARETTVSGEVWAYAGPPIPVRIPSGRELLRVCVFLSATTNWERLERLLAALSGDLRIRSVQVKPHPNAYLTSKRALRRLSRLKNVNVVPARVRFSELSDGIDMALAGNSSIHLDAIRGGVPSFYVRDLDDSPHDLCGFVANHLVPLFNAETSLHRQAAAFFGEPAWESTRQCYLAPALVRLM